MRSRSNSQLSLGPMAVKPVVPASVAKDNELVLVRRCLREALDESGWKRAAVAKAMTDTGLVKVDEPYLAKMLADGPDAKSISALHLRALPDDIEALYAKKYAESFGQIVVAPAPDAETAARHLVSGVFGLLACTAAATTKKVGAA